MFSGIDEIETGVREAARKLTELSAHRNENTNFFLNTHDIAKCSSGSIGRFLGLLLAFFLQSSLLDYTTALSTEDSHVT